MTLHLSVLRLLHASYLSGLMQNRAIQYEVGLLRVKHCMRLKAKSPTPSLGGLQSLPVAGELLIASERLPSGKLCLSRRERR